jgi:hypothetical protein
MIDPTKVHTAVNIEEAPRRTKEELRAASLQKMEAMQREYWRLRNGKTAVMRCPYCLGVNVEGHKMCCNLFARAFKAILDRQDEVDSGFRVLQQVQGLMQGEVN